MTIKKKVFGFATTCFAALTIAASIILPPLHTAMSTAEDDLDAAEDGVADAGKTLEELDFGLAIAEQNFTDANCSQAALAAFTTLLFVTGSCASMQTESPETTLSSLQLDLSYAPEPWSATSTTTITEEVCTQRGIITGNCKNWQEQTFEVPLITTTYPQGPSWFTGQATYFSGLCGMHARSGTIHGVITEANQGPQYTISTDPRTQGQNAVSASHCQISTQAPSGNQEISQPISGELESNDALALRLVGLLNQTCQTAITDLRNYGNAYFAEIKQMLNSTVIPRYQAQIPPAQQNLSLWQNYKASNQTVFNAAQHKYNQHLLALLIPLFTALVAAVSLYCTGLTPSSESQWLLNK